jgi:ABC-type transport system involved in multi-copper enzyme maturation permease subunit
MQRTFVITRYTFLEAILQPIYSLLLTLAAAVLCIFGALPFFTLGEDTKMFKSVALDVVLLAVLLTTLFSTSKSIFEEIEDRTMLTLMSKPVQRWEVMIGKYLGIVLAALLGVIALGAVVILCTYLRVPNDYLLRTNSLYEGDLKQIADYRAMHIAGLIPSLFLTWLQICVLAAIGVALSTRFSLVVNLPSVILLYIAGNLTRFLFPLSTGPLAGKPIAQGVAWVASLVLPYLEVFDLRKWAILGAVRMPGTAFINDTQGVSLSFLASLVLGATVYAVTYITFALSAGMWLFKTRELGGGEG